MATLASSAFSLPNNLASGLWSKVQTGSTVARLSGQEPMMFGVSQYMTFTGKPKGEVVAEGANKSQSQPTLREPRPRCPARCRSPCGSTKRSSGPTRTTSSASSPPSRDAGSEALARALDLITYHGINPLSGSALSGSPAKVTDTTNSVEINTATLTKPDVDIDSAVGLVIADGYQPNGIAFDPAFSYTLATRRNATTEARKLYPELGTGQNVSSFSGSTRRSPPPSRPPRPATATNVKAIVGDFSAIRWGVQKQVPVEVIRFGDPDGAGDLKRANQIAIRLEVVYGIAIMDTDAFAKIIDAVANS
jgi:hypothetical protein